MNDTHYDTPPAAATAGQPAASARSNRIGDKYLMKMIEPMTAALANSGGSEPCSQLVPSYNAIVAAAKGNHPDDPFLAHLTPLSTDEYISGAQMLALLGQLRIVFEAWLEQGGA